MEYRLEELFDLQMGKTPSRSVTEYWESGNNKWISIADLSKCGKYIYDTKECLSDIAVSESGIKQIPANTVVMSFKLSIGKTAITSEPMYSNEAIMSYYRLFVCSKFYSPVLSCTAHAAPQPHKRAKRRVRWLFRIRVLRVASAPHRADLGSYCK